VKNTKAKIRLKRYGKSAFSSTRRELISLNILSEFFEAEFHFKE